MMEQLNVEDDGEEYEGAQRHDQFDAVALAQLQSQEDKIYLDSCTTSSTFTSEKHLTDVVSEKKGLAIRCNAGTVKTNRRGNFGGLKVWSMGEGIANVLSLGELSKLYRVTFDSDEGYFVVHTKHGEVHFVMDESGMPCLDLASNEEAATMLIQTVQGNCEGYTPREIKEAREAMAAKAMMFHPSELALKEGGKDDQEEGGAGEGGARGCAESRG